MRRKITLTIDSDLYNDLEDLPRKVSVSEFVNFMLKGYVETFKRGRELTQEEVDEIVEKLGGNEFREKLRNTFPTLDKATALAEWIKNAMAAGSKIEAKK
jgi:predicted CopG family antitoxin